MKTQGFTTGFRIAHDPENIGKEQKWFETGLPDNIAKEAYVPSYVHLFFPKAYGIAWYETRFTPKFKADEFNELVLKFETSLFITEVYVNGAFAGSHKGVEDPFEINVTKYIKDGENLLSIRVSKPYSEMVDGYTIGEIPHRNQLETGIMPGTCHNVFGICGKLELALVPKVRITDIFLNGNPKTGKIEAKVTVLNNFEEEKKAKLSLLAGPKVSGEIEVELKKEVTLKVGENLFEEELEIDEVCLWSPKDPFLYNTETKIKTENTKHRIVKHCGFREFKVNEKGWFTLNGKRVVLRCSHTGNSFLWGANIPVVDNELWHRDFILAKSVGLNCVRFISGGATPEQLSFCDELGLMVYEEPYSAWLQKDSERAEELYKYDLLTLIKRDRSHPCIVMWGLLNETVPTPPFGDCCVIARNCLPDLRELDKTRAVIYSSGRFDGLVNVGSVSNPYSDKWECLWDGEDENSTEVVKFNSQDPGAYLRKVGDKHAYPRMPISKYDIELMRNDGEKPFFFSEYGVGSLLDTQWLLRIIEQYKMDIESPDCAMIKFMDEQFMRDYTQYGIDKYYAFPIDLLRESQQLNARQRAQCFDILRSNPKCCGFSMTGLLDHSICGEGMWTLMREFKPGSAEVFQRGMAPLKWCLFTSDSHVYSGRPFEIEAVIANEDILEEKTYPVAIKIIGNGKVVFEKYLDFTPTKEQLELLSIPVLKEEIALNVEEGEYTLRAEILKGAAATDGTLKFYISNEAYEFEQPLRVGAIGINEKVKLFLHSKGVEFVSLDEVSGEKAVLVGDIEDEAKEEVFSKLTSLAKEGKTIILASRFAMEKGDEMCYYLPIDEKPDRYPHHNRFTDWLYHKEYIAHRHPYFNNLPCGKIMDWEYYMYLISGACYMEGKAPDETIVACVGPGNINPNGYEGGFNIGSYNIGKGKFVVNSLNILENIGVNPAADRLLVNILAEEA